jgi:hypothetical protein
MTICQLYIIQVEFFVYNISALSGKMVPVPKRAAEVTRTLFQGFKRPSNVKEVVMNNDLADYFAYRKRLLMAVSCMLIAHRSKILST